RLHNVPPLEDIEQYKTGDNVRLHRAVGTMQEHEATIKPIDPKDADNNGIKNYFKSIFPEFDEERVYVSDMKKMLKWYDLLKANDLLKFDAPEETTASETEEVAAPAIEAEEKPAKKAKAKKTEPTEGEETEEKPAKKAKAKK